MSMKQQAPPISTIFSPSRNNFCEWKGILFRALDPRSFDVTKLLGNFFLLRIRIRLTKTFRDLILAARKFSASQTFLRWLKWQCSHKTPSQWPLLMSIKRKTKVQMAALGMIERSWCKTSKQNGDSWKKISEKHFNFRYFSVIFSPRRAKKIGKFRQTFLVVFDIFKCEDPRAEN